MKLYFHFHLGPVFHDQILTAVAEVPCQSTKVELKSMLESICTSLRKRKKIELIVSNLEVSTCNKKKELALDVDASSLDDRLDLKVTIKQAASTRGVTKYEKTVINKNKEFSDQQQAGKTKILSNSTPVDKGTAELLKKASACLEKKMNNLALGIYQEVLVKWSTNYEATFGMAYIYFKAGRYNKSISFFERLVSKDSTNHVVLLDYAKALVETKEETKAISVISRCINDLKRAGADAKAIHDANVSLADTLEALDQLQNAFQLYLSVAQMTEKQHVDALLGYARVGYKLGVVTLDDVFLVVLNAVALRKNDAKIQSFFSQMVQEKGGCDSLQKQMHEAWNDAPAVVYIATFLRECGALGPCLRILEHAHKLAPKSIDVTLLTMHVMENVCNLDSALKFVADFLDSKHDRQVLRKIDLSQFVQVIRLQMNGKTKELETLVKDKIESLKEEPPKKASPTGSMADLELQLLAVYFTVVKIFFVKGEITLVSYLVELLKPLYYMNKELHKTLIRNEQAFYACINQIYEACPPPTNSPERSAQNKVFIIGDSHVLPLAWRSINFKGKEYTTNPVLVTGLKIWHLRNESHFYTKRCYEKAVQKIPSGSSCIFLIGEIDCREGIQSAVEKCAYDSVDESIAALVEIYVKMMIELKKRKKLNVFVHPVAPVLKETNQIVTQFNAALRERLKRTSSLTWLEILDELVCADTGYLRSEFNFDGAHLHPKYIDLVQKDLEKHS